MDEVGQRLQLVRLILSVKDRCRLCLRRFGPHVAENANQVCDDCAVREDQLRGTGAERTRRVRNAFEGYLKNHEKRAGNPWRRSR